MPFFGVTVTVETICELVLLVVVKAGRFPVPEAVGSPIAVALVADHS